MVAELPTILISAPGQSVYDPLQEASSSSPYPGHDATLTKDKGKMFADIPIIPFFAHMASKPLRIASSSPPRRSSPYEIQGVQDQNLPAQTKTDKGKTTVNASLMLKQLEIPLSRTSGCSLSEEAAYSPKLQEVTRKEKDKVGLETPNTEESEPSTPHSSLASPAASGKIFSFYFSFPLSPLNTNPLPLANNCSERKLYYAELLATSCFLAFQSCSWEALVSVSSRWF